MPLQSFCFSLQPDQAEVFLAMRRFLPNFKVLVGNNQVTLSIKDFLKAAALTKKKLILGLFVVTNKGSTNPF